MKRLFLIGNMVLAGLFVFASPALANCPRLDGKYEVGRGWEGTASPGITVVSASDAEVVVSVARGYTLQTLCVKTGNGVDVAGDFSVGSDLPVAGLATVAIASTRRRGAGLSHLTFETADTPSSPPVVPAALPPPVPPADPSPAAPPPPAPPPAVPPAPASAESPAPVAPAPPAEAPPLASPPPSPTAPPSPAPPAQPADLPASPSPATAPAPAFAVSPGAASQPSRTCSAVSLSRRSGAVGARLAIRVRSLDANGAPQAGMRVTARGAGIRTLATTTARGYALLVLKPERAGVVTVRVGARGSCVQRIAVVGRRGSPRLAG